MTAMPRVAAGSIPKTTFGRLAKELSLGASFFEGEAFFGAMTSSFEFDEEEVGSERQPPKARSKATIETTGRCLRMVVHSFFPLSSRERCCLSSAELN